MRGGRRWGEAWVRWSCPSPALTREKRLSVFHLLPSVLSSAAQVQTRERQGCGGCWGTRPCPKGAAAPCVFDPNLSAFHISEQSFSDALGKPSLYTFFTARGLELDYL